MHAPYSKHSLCLCQAAPGKGKAAPCFRIFGTLQFPVISIFLSAFIIPWVETLLQSAHKVVPRKAPKLRFLPSCYLAFV